MLYLAAFVSTVALQPKRLKEGAMRLSHRIALAALALGVLVSSPVLAATHFVSINGTSFSPANLMINTGDTVMWLNNDILPHTATAGNPCTPSGLFNGVMDSGGDFSFQFNNVATIPYYCAFHCLQGMRGSIVVTAPVPVQAKTWGGIKAIYAAQK
jgi:plastocyanin